MSDVKRYGLEYSPDAEGDYLAENKNGAWVTYDDYAALQARLAEVEAEQIMLRAERDGLASMLLSVQQESIAATKALATARRDAWGEAANFYDSSADFMRDRAAAIRALIAQEDAAP